MKVINKTPAKRIDLNLFINHYVYNDQTEILLRSTENSKVSKSVHNFVAGNLLNIHHSNSLYKDTKVLHCRIISKA